MNTDYLTQEIERYQKAIQEDEKNLAVIEQSLKYNRKQLKNAEKALQEINANTEKT
jgi:septal ring factor EnvC (AmiA/AmiB activator)